MIWHIQYFVMGVIALILAIEFFKSKNGQLRLILIGKNIAITFCVWFILYADLRLNLTPDQYHTIRAVAMTPLLVVMIIFLTYILKGQK